MDNAITKSELIEVLDIYIAPFYQLIGGILAIVVGIFAIWFVIIPWTRRLRE